jgi:peptidyl-tRNA hydrolase
VVDHVLSTFSEEEFKGLDKIIDRAIEDVDSIISQK